MYTNENVIKMVIKKINLVKYGDIVFSIIVLPILVRFANFGLCNKKYLVNFCDKFFDWGFGENFGYHKITIVNLI